MKCTVSDLMAKLSRMPSEALVVSYDSEFGGWHDIEEPTLEEVVESRLFGYERSESTPVRGPLLKVVAL